MGSNHDRNALKNSWEDLTGYKPMNLHPKSYASLLECIEFHKRTFFSVDAAEKLRYYLTCCVKKPMKVTIKAHVTRIEILTRYTGMLPTIKYSSLAVASTERGNIPFIEATHASIILSGLPLAWRNQYDLTHQTVPESPLRCSRISKLSRKSSPKGTTTKPEPIRLRLRQLQPPKRMSHTCPRSAVAKVPKEEPVRKDGPVSIASGGY